MISLDNQNDMFSRHQSIRNSEIYVKFLCESVQNDKVLHIQNRGKI